MPPIENSWIRPCTPSKNWPWIQAHVFNLFLLNPTFVRPLLMQHPLQLYSLEMESMRHPRGVHVISTWCACDIHVVYMILVPGFNLTFVRLLLMQRPLHEVFLFWWEYLLSRVGHILVWDGMGHDRWGRWDGSSLACHLQKARKE